MSAVAGQTRLLTFPTGAAPTCHKIGLRKRGSAACGQCCWKAPGVYVLLFGHPAPMFTVLTNFSHVVRYLVHTKLAIPFSWRLTLVVERRRICAVPQQKLDGGAWRRSGCEEKNWDATPLGLALHHHFWPSRALRISHAAHVQEIVGNRWSASSCFAWLMTCSAVLPGTALIGTGTDKGTILWQRGPATDPPSNSVLANDRA
jgi:hypothetical protein